MPAFVDVKFVGDKELLKTFASFPKKLQERLARKAMRKGAQLIKQTAEALAPVETGTLLSSFRLRSRVRKGVPMATVSITDRVLLKKLGKKHITSKEGLLFYAGFVELGTKKMKAKPFLRPAVDMNQNRVREIVKDETARLIKFEAKRAKRK